MQKARRHGTRPLRPLVGTRFQVLFHSPSGVLFTFPSRYSFTIGLSGVFSLGGWCRRIQRGFHRSPPTQDTHSDKFTACTGFSPSMIGLPMPFQFAIYPLGESYNPTLAVTKVVWALPCSLATTYGIIVIFFSCGYLDVSVPRVCPP